MLAYFYLLSNFCCFYQILIKKEEETDLKWGGHNVVQTWPLDRRVTYFKILPQRTWY